MRTRNDIEMIRRFNYWNWYGKPILATVCAIAAAYALALWLLL